MPTYITLGRWTEQGIRAIKEGPRRLDAAKQAFQSGGGVMTAFYLVYGDYDFVAVSEFPDDASYTRVALSIAAQGNVRTTTLKAFTEQEYRQIIVGLP